MKMQSNRIEADATRSLFRSNEVAFNNHNIIYAKETTIDAVQNGKAAYEVKEKALTDYRSELLIDADNIRSLGKEFEDLDRKIQNDISLFL